MTTVQLTGIQVVVFDLDDTLYPEETFVFSGFRAVADWLLERMQCPFDPAERMRQIFATGDRRHVFNQVLKELNYPENASMVKSMVEIYRTHKPGIQLFEDAERALSRWKQRFALALISDGPWRMQKNKVEALQLYDQLNPVVLTAEWGEEFSKPHNRAFEYIQRTTGRQGSECVYVADNVSKDFIAPRRMGWRTVQVRRENGIYADLVPPPEGRAEADVRTLDQIEVSY